jgi:hypothetical protein
MPIITKNVTAELLKLLRYGEAAIANAKHVIKHGAGNLRNNPNLAEAQKRLAIARNCFYSKNAPGDGPRRNSILAMWSGGGVCVEFAALVFSYLRSILKKYRIAICCSLQLNHTFVVIFPKNTSARFTPNQNHIFSEVVLGSHDIIVDAWQITESAQALLTEDYNIAPDDELMILKTVIADRKQFDLEHIEEKYKRKYSIQRPTPELMNYYLDTIEPEELTMFDQISMAKYGNIYQYICSGNIDCLIM